MGLRVREILIAIPNNRTKFSLHFRFLQALQGEVSFPLPDLVLTGIKTATASAYDLYFMEGEGDRSLAYWRDVHEDFFAEEFAETELEFNGQTSILCEEFKVVYRAIDIN